jgi:hypothetical protein
MVKWLSRANTCLACIIRSVLEGNTNQKGSLGKNLQKSNCWLYISVIRPAEQLFRNTYISVKIQAQLFWHSKHVYYSLTLIRTELQLTF